MTIAFDLSWCPSFHFHFDLDELREWREYHCDLDHRRVCLTRICCSHQLHRCMDILRRWVFFGWNLLPSSGFWLRVCYLLVWDQPSLQEERIWLPFSFLIGKAKSNMKQQRVRVHLSSWKWYTFLKVLLWSLPFYGTSASSRCTQCQSPELFSLCQSNEGLQSNYKCQWYFHLWFLKLFPQQYLLLQAFSSNGLRCLGWC